MNAEDFVRRIKGFSELTAPQQLPYLLFFLVVEEGAASAGAREVDALREKLHLARSPSATHLSRASGGKSRIYVKRQRGYSLERSERERISALVRGRPSVAATSASLRSTTSGVTATPARGYLEEAVGCFEAGFHRAAIVMAWCLGFSTLRAWLFAKHLAVLNTKMSTWKKPFSIGTLDDFDELTERTVIDTARESGAIGKGEHKVLVSLLDQRNTYAHPTGRTVSEAVAEAFVQQVVDEVLRPYL